MDNLDLTKTVASFVVGTGTTKIVTAIIQNNVMPEKITDKVFVISAGVVIGMIATDMTKKYTSAKIDEAAVWWKTNIHKKTA